MAFADDLFLVCGADAPTFGIIKDALEDFHGLPRLQPNIQKSEIFLLGLLMMIKMFLGLFCQFVKGLCL